MENRCEKAEHGVQFVGLQLSDALHGLTETFLPDAPVRIDHDLAGERIIQGLVDHIPGAGTDLGFPIRVY